MMNGSDHLDTLSLEEDKRNVPVYYVQSPSRDSHEEDKSSSNQGTTPPTSFADSPTTHYHSSSLFGGAGRHSRLHSSNSRPSSASRVSGNGVRRKSVDRQRWRAIEEEVGEDATSTRRSNVWGVGVLCFSLLFVLSCFLLWGASRPFLPRIYVKSLIVHDFYTGEGSDLAGVPTKLLTVNSSLTMRVHNHAKFSGIHISSTPFDLMYYDLVVASGQMKKYSQPRKSWRDVTVDIEAHELCLYGASTGFAADRTALGVPMTLVFKLQIKGCVVGKLVMSKHRIHVSCSFAMTASAYYPITIVFPESSCRYH